MSSSITSLYRDFFREYMPEGREERLLLDFSGYLAEIVSNSSSVIERIRQYYRDFLPEGGVPPQPDVSITVLDGAIPDPAALGLRFSAKEPDPGKSKIKEEFVDLEDGRVVRKRLTGMMFLFGQGLHLAVGPCRENDNQVVNFINNRFIEWTLGNGSLLFHAAGVAVEKGNTLSGLALAGFSGMGKSTLALRIMSHGATFVSNDRLMVRRKDKQLIMYGVAKMPRINPGTILHNKDLASVIEEHERLVFEAMDPDELWSLEHKYDAFIDECFGSGRFRLSAPMRGLVLLNWKKPHEGDEEEVSVQRVDLHARTDLMPAFMKHVGLFYTPTPGKDYPDFSEEAYLELLGECPVYELTGTADFEAAARACLELF